MIYQWFKFRTAITEKKDTVTAKQQVISKTEKAVPDAAKLPAPLKKDSVAETVKMEASPEDDASAFSPEEIPEAAKTAVRTHALQLSANEYKVGLFGGI